MCPQIAFGGSNCKKGVAANVLGSLKSFRSATSVPKIAFGSLKSFSECNRVGNSRPWPSQVALEFYIILKIIKVDTGSLKIFKDPHWIFEDI